MVTPAMWDSRESRFPDHTPTNKEYYLLRSIFEEHFPSKSALDTVPKVGTARECSPIKGATSTSQNFQSCHRSVADAALATNSGFPICLPGCNGLGTRIAWLETNAGLYAMHQLWVNLVSLACCMPLQCNCRTPLGHPYWTA